MRLSPLEADAIERFRARLASRFGDRLERVVVFGSRARGEGHEESDIDLVILVRDLARAERIATIDDAFAIERDLGVVLAPLVRDAARWPRSPLAAVVADEGVRL